MSVLKKTCVEVKFAYNKLSNKKKITKPTSQNTSGSKVNQILYDQKAFV